MFRTGFESLLTVIFPDTILTCCPSRAVQPLPVANSMQNRIVLLRDFNPVPFADGFDSMLFLHQDDTLGHCLSCFPPKREL